jgi:hypothetical protein
VFCNKNARNTGMWIAIAIGVTAASMSASKHSKEARHSAPVEQVSPRVSFTLPVLALM